MRNGYRPPGPDSANSAGPSPPPRPPALPHPCGSGFSFSMAATTLSMSSSDTGRFSHAFQMPLFSFRRSKVSRRPSLLMTCVSAASIYSKVVKRFPQSRHSRRRRMESPSWQTRELTTLSFMLRQKGTSHWRFGLQFFSPSPSLRERGRGEGVSFLPIKQVARFASGATEICEFGRLSSVRGYSLIM